MSVDLVLDRPPLDGPQIEPIDWRDLPAEPWRNGRGLTRTLASRSAEGELHWRLSVADVAQGGPFSTFQGLDRTALLLQGEGLVLESPHQTLAFERLGDVQQFPGETPVYAWLGAGPACLWNLMVERRQFEGHMLSRHGTGCCLPAAPLVALMVLHGHMVAVAGREPRARLSAQQCLVFTDLREPLTLLAEEGQAHWAMAWVTPKG